MVESFMAVAAAITASMNCSKLCGADCHKASADETCRSMKLSRPVTAGS